MINVKVREDVAKAYSSPPWWYDIRGFFILLFAYNDSLSRQVRFFGRHFEHAHLEVACGSGTLLDIILKWRRLKRLPRREITAIDYAESMLVGARKRFDKSSDVTVLHADAADLPFGDERFDSVNIANSVHAFPEVDEALRDIHRVLKEGGTLAANVLLYPGGPRVLRWIATRVNAWGKNKGILHTPYTRDEIRAKFRDTGFEIVEEYRRGNACYVIARK